MSKEKNKPEIRFKDFEGEWDYKNGKVIFRVYYEKNHPELPVLSATQEYGMVVRDKAGFQVQHNKENEVSYKRVLPGQFVIHLRSFQGGFAHSPIEGITSPAYTIMEFQNKELHNDIFWKYLLSSKTFIKRLETVTYGIRDGRSISFNDFSELDFFVPKAEEQKKIGDLFNALDSLIHNLELKLEKLRHIKQSLLDLMFVDVENEGQMKPRIRFKGFEDEWEKMDLGTVSNRHFVPNNSLHHQNLLSLSYGKIIRKNIKSDKGLLPASFDTYQVVKKGVIVMRLTDLQNDHKSLRVGLASEEGIVSPAYICIFPNGNVLPSFLYQQLNYYDSILKLFYKMGDGMRQTLSYDDIKPIKVYLPHRIEQSNIKKFFDKTESHIYAIEQRLIKSRNIKQSLLQKMFV